MTIETNFDSNYRKVLVAARRARQIQNGSAALVPSRSTKACRIAQDEIEAGKISYVKKESSSCEALSRGPRHSDSGELKAPLVPGERRQVSSLTGPLQWDAVPGRRSSERASSAR